MTKSKPAKKIQIPKKRAVSQHPHPALADLARARGRPITAVDIAKKLGVAQSTVSRAFSPSSRISDTLRVQVLEMASSLGYRPNAIARSLLTAKSGIVALVMGDIGNPFYPELLEQLSVRLREAGMQLLLFVIPKGQSADDVLPEVLQYQVDGILISSARLSSHSAQICQGRSMPVVFMNRRVDDDSTWSVCCDNFAMAREVAHYLAGKGYRSPAFLSGESDTSTATDRLAGFQAGLREHGLTLRQCVDGSFSYESGFTSAKQLFSSRRKNVDSLFCANDIIALGALSYLRHVKGLSVPKDVAVVGFDDIRSASYPEYDLTTVRQPVAAMIDTAIGLLREGRSASSGDNTLIECHGQLVIRSTA